MSQADFSGSTECAQLVQLLSDSKFTVVLSGAGMSTESGIPDFRSQGGIWQNHQLLNAMTDHFLRYFPDEFWPLYKQTFLHPSLLAAQPNAGHAALAGYESQGRTVRIHTQNVDGLHQAAGSAHVSELHGSARSAYCPRCHTRYGVDAMLAEDVPICRWETPKGAFCETILHPDTVLFGQAVRHLDTAAADIHRCNLLLVLGTSLVVEPVAALPQYRSERTRLVIVNLSETYLDGEADLVVRRPIGQVLAAAMASVR